MIGPDDAADRAGIGTGTPTVVLYGRPGCHLCEEAREMIDDIRREGRHFELVEIDIESDDALLKRFLERIPVVEVSGAVVGELFVARASLESALDTVGT